VQFRKVFRVAVNRYAGQARFDDLIGEIPAEPGDQQRRRGREIVIVQHIDLDIGIEQLRTLQRESLQQRVQRGGHEVGGESARNAGKSRSNPRQRVTPRSVENDAPDRDDKHVARIHGRVADDTDKNDHRGQQRLRGDIEKRAYGGRNESGMLGNADAEHRNQHNSDRTEGHESFDHRGHELHEVLACKLIDDDDALARSRVKDIKSDVGKEPGKYPDDAEQRDEQYRRIRQRVADALHGTQKTLGRVGRGGRFCF